MHYYEVAPTRMIRPEKNAFTYACNSELAIGQIVEISVGKNNQIGVVLKKSCKPKDFQVKEITKIIEYSVPKQLIELSNWISNYYIVHLSLALSLIIPTGILKKRRIKDGRELAPNRKRTNFLLNKEQRETVDKITSLNSGTYMIQGITGSGKTAVYVELVKNAIQRNKSAIILVPEIGLTSQIFAEFSNQFENIVLTHSNMTESERHSAWAKIIDSDKPMIIIGPRSALFMPVKNLGLIVIDECHDQSYKQDKSPRYSALRVATILGSLHEAKVIFGSATPNIEDKYLSDKNDRPYFKITKSAVKNSQPAKIKLIDFKEKNNFKQHRFLSDSLIDMIEKDLKNNKQVLIYHNRRGSASTSLCKSCGWMAVCPNCNMPLSLHSKDYKMICHVCGYSEKPHNSCPICHETDIIYKGIGTQLIESELIKLFKTAKIARFDSDTEKSKTLANRYQELYDNKIDIIVGTQAISKGLDLPNLKTVGIIQADNGLILPDYSTNERVFQLISQVIGRVGRNEDSSDVIIQTYKPDHYAIKFALNQDYDGFYQYEIKKRQQELFPPFSYILKIICSYKTEQIAINNIAKLASKIKLTDNTLKVIGPAPSFYEKRGDKYYWQLILKSSVRNRMYQIIDILPNDGHWQYELDAPSLL